MITIPRIKGDRVFLRAPDAGDVDAIVTLFAHEPLTRSWGAPKIAETKTAKLMLARIRQGFEQRSRFVWAVTQRQTGKVIGFCELFNIAEIHCRAELRFTNGASSLAQGFMTEALRALIAFGFEVLSLQRIECVAHAYDANALDTLEQLGFKAEGTLRNRYRIGVRTHDGVIHGLLLREWQRATTTDSMVTHVDELLASVRDSLPPETSSEHRLPKVLPTDTPVEEQVEEEDDELVAEELPEDDEPAAPRPPATDLSALPPLVKPAFDEGEADEDDLPGVPHDESDLEDSSIIDSLVVNVGELLAEVESDLEDD